MEDRKLVYADDVRRAILKTEPRLAHIVDDVPVVQSDCHWATEQAYKNGYLKGYDKGLEDALDVTIVRCKDCTEWDEKEQECSHWYGFRKDDFCSHGERRTNETNNL